MSTISKVFTVVNIVLSLFLLGSVAAILSRTTDYRDALNTQTAKWDSERTTLSAQLAEAQGIRDAKNAENSDLINERQGLQADVEAAQVRIDELTNTNNDLRSQLSGLNNTFSALESQMRDASERNDTLVAQNQQYRDERDSALESQANAEDDRERLDRDIARLEGDIGELERSLTSVAGERDNLLAVMAGLEASGVDPMQIVGNTVPPIDGAVSSVGPGFVVLDVGSNDAVQIGYPFQIFRGKTYVGRVIVDEVKQDNAIARVTLQNEGVEFQIGDSAATRL